MSDGGHSEVTDTKARAGSAGSVLVMLAAGQPARSSAQTDASFPATVIGVPLIVFDKKGKVPSSGVSERRCVLDFEREIVLVAVPPVLARFVRLDDGVVLRPEVRGRVPVR
jgi:hypothetical protein